MERINLQDLKNIIQGLQQTFAENKEYLCELDSMIGDGDHGLSVNSGFSAAWSQVQGQEYPHAGSLLQAVAMALMANISGAIGPIFSVMFLEGSEAVEGKTQLTPADLSAFFAKGLKAVMVFGGAKPGDKTMVDALAPAVEAMENHHSRCIMEMLEAAVTAAEKGVIHTKTLQARRGRSRFVNERSIGHQDAGATSVYLLLDSMLKTLQGQEE